MKQDTTNSVSDFGSAPRPVEQVLLGYLLITALLMILFRQNLPGWPKFFTIHCFGAATLFWLRRYKTVRVAPWAWIRRAYPLLAAPIFYLEMASLNDLIFPSRYFDSVVVHWEELIFRGQMAIELRRLLPQGLFSEYLHFAYLSYYLLGPILWISLARRRKWKESEEALTVIGVTFTTCMLWFIAFPVTGPFHHFEPPDPQSLGLLFPPLVHALLHAGSSIGTAFPSSHVAVASAILVMAYRLDRHTFWIFVALVPALALGAVYGGFHYAIDAFCGALWAAVTIPAGIWLHRKMQPRFEA